MFVIIVNTANGNYAIVIISSEKDERKKRKMKTRVWEGKEGEYLLPSDYAINGDGEIFLVKAGREEDGYFAGYYDDYDLVVEEGTDYMDKKNKEIFTGDLVKARSKRTNLYHIYEIKRIKGEYKFILEGMSFSELDLTEEEIVGNIHKKWDKKDGRRR